MRELKKNILTTGMRNIVAKGNAEYLYYRNASVVTCDPRREVAKLIKPA